MNVINVKQNMTDRKIRIWCRKAATIVVYIEDVMIHFFCRPINFYYTNIYFYSIYK